MSRTLRNPNVSDPKATSWHKFVGQRVAVSLNLAVCGFGKPEKPGEACWTVRAKPTNTSAPLGYASDVLLTDCEFVIHHGLLKRKRAMGKKDVFAFAVGTAVAMSPSPPGLPTGWYRVGFNPLAPPKGLGEDSFMLVSGDKPREVRKPIDRLDWFFGHGRKSLGALARVRMNPTERKFGKRGWVVLNDDCEAVLAWDNGMPMVFPTKEEADEANLAAGLKRGYLARGLDAWAGNTEPYEVWAGVRDDEHPLFQGYLEDTVTVDDLKDIADTVPPLDEP